MILACRKDVAGVLRLGDKVFCDVSTGVISSTVLLVVLLGAQFTASRMLKVCTFFCCFTLFC